MAEFLGMFWKIPTDKSIVLVPVCLCMKEPIHEMSKLSPSSSTQAAEPSTVMSSWTYQKMLPDSVVCWLDMLHNRLREKKRKVSSCASSQEWAWKKKNKPTKHVCCCRCAFSTYVLSPTFTSYTSLWMKVFGADAWYKIPLTGTIEGSVGVMAASVGSTHWSWQTFINIWKKNQKKTNNHVLQLNKKTMLFWNNMLQLKFPPKFPQCMFTWWTCYIDPGVIDSTH